MIGIFITQFKEVREEGAYSFMCTLNYLDISENYIAVLQYCLKFSDTFSVITNLKKPYSAIPPFCEHDAVIFAWNSCLVEQIIGIKKWPGTQTRNNHKVMNLYDSRKFRTTIFDLPNLFLPIENHLPEDVCFYRNGSAWVYTISHERTAFMLDASKEDITFFKAHNIRFSNASAE